ncbi:hypothetical protein DVS28_b0616 (plasmid) [Euzebya pacifica]|uniref:Uncharacterized protein n=1 Tax=Euzebya pacifica TaxID=1608957 RepID=A0A346Y7A9_9ACTN|nr:hypothetical protein DVS28_b0616 [Euzebya pacifica]
MAAPLRRWAGHDGVPVSSPMFNGMPVRAQVRTDGDHVIVDWAEDPVGVPATDGMRACDYGVTHPSGPDTDSACPDCAMVFRVIGQWWKEQTYAVRVNGTAVYARSLLSTVAAMHDRPLLVGGEAGNVLDTVTAAPAGDGLPHLRLLEWWRHNGDAPVVGAVTDGDETICGLPVGQPVDAAAAGRMCSRCDEGLDRVQFSVRDSNDPPELPSPGPVHRIDRPPIGIVLGQPTGRTEGRLVDVLDTRVLIPDPARQTITATTPDAVTVLHTCQPGDTRDRGCIACATPGRGAAWLREVEHRWDTTAGGEYPHWQAPDGTTAWTLTDDSVSTQLFDDAAVARVLTGPRTVRIAAAVTPRRPGRLHAMALDRIVGIDAHTHASVAVRPFDILWTRAVCGGEAAPAQARGEGLCKRCGDRVRRMRRDGIVVEFGGHDHDPDGDDGRRLAELLDRVG